MAYEDRLIGAIIELGTRRRIVYLGGALLEKLPGALLHRGGIVVRYATAFFFEPDSFYIQRIVDDFGRDFRDQEAIDFAYKKGDAFPRAAVMGERASTGAQEQIFLKQLDLARHLIPVAYANETEEVPIGQIEAALWIDDEASGLLRMDADDESLPEGLIEAIPAYRLPPSELQGIEQQPIFK
jgi:hypothetical protein